MNDWVVRRLDSNVSESLIFNALDSSDSVPAVGMANPGRLTAECHRGAYHVRIRGRRTAVYPRDQSAAGCLAFVPAAAAKDAEKRIAERFPEVFVEVGVDERVQCGVKVTDPEEHFHDYIWTVARFTTQRDRQVPDEKKAASRGRKRP